MKPIVYLSGGVGGTRLAHGLARALHEDQLTLIINTGDDFAHWGLSISPDLDTVMYSLADLADVARGWGLAHDTFETLASVVRLGGEGWFQLGDRDLGTHLVRSARLRDGRTLTEVTSELCCALGVRQRLLPMSDDPYQTMIETDDGCLMFQHWLVRQRGLPTVRRVWFSGEARASDAVLRALEQAQFAIIGPSNPYVSIDPILSLPGVRERLADLRVIAVSPIVHGRAIKGPLAGMLHTLANAPASAASIALHYGSLLSALVVERGDEAAVSELPVLGTDTVMHAREASLRLARAVLGFAQELGFGS